MIVYLASSVDNEVYLASSVGNEAVVFGCLFLNIATVHEHIHSLGKFSRNALDQSCHLQERSRRKVKWLL